VSQENVDRYALAARVHALLAPELAAEGWDLVDVRVFRGGGRLQVRLYVDLPGEERIDLDGCAQASRAASMFLEEVDLFGGAWVLEVSSPGIRRPLRTEAHFAAVVGRDVEMKWRSRGEARKLRGRVTDVADGTVTVSPAGVRAAVADEEAADEEAAAAEAAPQDEAVRVPVAEILEANLDHDFDAQAVIREDRRRRKLEQRDKRADRRQKRSRPKKGGADHSGPGSDTEERDG
jgi:ribosome maturation factor RimP